MTEKKRILELDGIQNLREIGGYKTALGTIKGAKLLRSGNLDKVPEVSQQAFLNYGVTHIIDLRDEWEQREYPNSFTHFSGIQYQNLPFIGDKKLKDHASEEIFKAGTLLEVYVLLLENCKEQIKVIFEGIATASEQGCTVIHCVAGKDRTGLITALLLGTLHASPDLIIDDYVLTFHLEVAQQEKLSKDGGDSFDPEQAKQEASNAAITMFGLIEYLLQEYESIDGFLNSIGVSAKTLTALRHNLIVLDES